MLFLYLLFITSVLSDKFCINCKFFTKHPLSSNIYGKCKLFPTDDYDKLDYLVSGKNKFNYRYCSSIRNDENMCGLKGKYYEKKIELFSKIKNNICFLKKDE